MTIQWQQHLTELQLKHACLNKRISDKLMKFTPSHEVNYKSQCVESLRNGQWTIHHSKPLNHQTNSICTNCILHHTTMHIHVYILPLSFHPTSKTPSPPHPLQLLAHQQAKNKKGCSKSNAWAWFFSSWPRLRSRVARSQGLASYYRVTGWDPPKAGHELKKLGDVSFNCWTWDVIDAIHP